MFFYSPFFGLVVPKVSVSLVDANGVQSAGDKGSKASSIAYTDIKKGKNGKMVMVRHKTKDGSLAGDARREVTTEDVKKDDKDNVDKKDEKKEDSDKIWTAEEDAKIKKMKAENKTWAEIGAELGRPKYEPQARFKLIKDDGSPGGGDQKKDEKNGGGKKDEKGDDKKDEAANGGDFTAEDDAKIKELLAANTGYKKIAEALARKLDQHLKDHLAKLKAEGVDAAKGGNDSKKANGDDKKGKKQGNEDGNRKDKKSKDEPSKEDKKDEKPVPEKKMAKPKAEKKSSEDKGEKERKSLSKEERKPASKAVSIRSRRGHHSEARFTMKEWKTLQEDNLFNFGELQLLAELAMKDGDVSWLRVASAFLDKTGRRVHPDDIADKFNEMAAIGR